MTDDEHRKCDIFIRSLSLLNVDEDGLTADNLPGRHGGDHADVPGDQGHYRRWRVTVRGTTAVVADTCTAQHKHVAAQSHSSEGGSEIPSGPSRWRLGAAGIFLAREFGFICEGSGLPCQKPPQPKARPDGRLQGFAYPPGQESD